MSTTPYTVATLSRRVSDQVRAVMARAEADGELLVALQALRWAKEEMERTPHEFGESRVYRPHAKLHERIAFAPPLRFHFAIHDDTLTVFVGRVAWAKRK